MARNKTVSLKDVAAASGVSTTTASVVLNGRADEFRIAPDTQAKVREAASALGYRATTTSHKRRPADASDLWCVFVPTDFNVGPTEKLIAGIAKYSSDRGLSTEAVLFPFVRGRLHEKARWISSDFARGAIMVGLDDDDFAFLDDAEFDVPVVLFNRAGSAHPTVNVDDYQVGQSAMRHYLERGIERPALISPDYASRSLSLRAVGFLDEYRQAVGLNSPPTIAHEHAANSYAGGYQAMQVLLAAEPRPTGVFVLHDQMIAGVMHAIAQAGLVPSRDIDVLSYGDSPANTILSPTVSSFSVPIAEMSYDCARILHEATGGSNTTENAMRMFTATLIARESSPPGKR